VEMAFTNINELAADRQLVTPEICPQNDYYGHATVLKKFIGWRNDVPLPFAIEHGAFAGDFVWSVDLNSPVPAIMCSPKRRIAVLKSRTDKIVESIGPVIQYATSMLSDDQIRSEKLRLGKNLLVFPAHSTHHITANYDIEAFLKEIKIVAENFDTVRICLYWKDVLGGVNKYYEQAGIECVSAGHIFDADFLPRLKSLLTIADMTMSNCDGSYIGFSIMMGKPHYLWKQPVELSAKSDEIIKRDSSDYDKKDELTNQLDNIFSVFMESISAEQQRFADDYWGIFVNKNKEDIVSIADNALNSSVERYAHLSTIHNYFHKKFLAESSVTGKSLSFYANNGKIMNETHANMQIKLKRSEVEWIGLRFLDPIGRVFKYNGEYYRAIYCEKGDYVKSLFSRGVVTALIKSDLLVDMDIVDVEMEGFGLVVKPVTSRFQMPPFMWCWHMIKDAALKYVKMNLLLLDHKLGTLDGHINNMVQTANAKPVWVDLGSITPLNNEFVGLDEFCRCFYFPLILASAGSKYWRMARLFMKEGGISGDEMIAISGFKLPEFASRKEMLFYLYDNISRLVVDNQQTLWSSYMSAESLANVELNYNIGDPESVHVRSALIANIIKDINPKNVIDLGCNAGYYTLLTSKTNIPVLGLDFDETSINKLYDVINRYYGDAEITIGVHNAMHIMDFKAELVLALALTHHLFFTNSCSFEAIAKILSSYSDKHLITESMPLGLGTGRSGRPSPDPLPEGYKLELFKSSLEKYFGRVESIDYPVPPGVSPRVLIVCKDRLRPAGTC